MAFANTITAYVSGVLSSAFASIPFALALIHVAAHILGLAGAVIPFAMPTMAFAGITIAFAPARTFGEAIHRSGGELITPLSLGEGLGVRA